MHRHSNHRVEAFLKRQCLNQHLAERRSQALYLSVLEKLDQVLQRPLVAAETVRRIETRQLLAAGGATAALIECVRVQKRRPAGTAMKRLLKGLRNP